MTYFDDLSQYDYYCARSRSLETKNIGWLDSNHAFETAEPSEELLDRLWNFCKISVVQLRGIHDCNICNDIESHYVERKGEHLLLSTSEIRVFSNKMTIYAAPTLIFHYVSVHKYRPPDEFVQALYDGPAPPSPKYFEILDRLGLEWNKTSMPSERPIRFRLGEIPKPEG